MTVNLNELITDATKQDLTDAETAILDEIVRTSSGSLYQLLHSALSSVIYSRATPENITDAKTSINGNVSAEAESTRNEIIRTTTGSLYALLVAAITDAINQITGNTNSKSSDLTNHVDTKTAEVIAEILKTGTGSAHNLLVDALSPLITARATPANVTNAQTAIVNSVTSEGSATRDEITRTTTGSLFNLLEVVVNDAKDILNVSIGSESSNIQDAITAARNVLEGVDNRTLTELYDLVVSRATPAQITAAKTEIETAITTAREVLEGTSNRDLTDVYDLVNGRATPAQITAAQNNINGHTDTERAVIINAVNDARDAVNGEMIRTTAGSLFALLSAEITSARDYIHNNREFTVSKPIQRGRLVTTIAQNGTRDLTISAVDMNNAKLNVHLGAYAGTAYSSDLSNWITYELIDSTTVRFFNTHGAFDTVQLRASWEVDENV